MRSCLHDSVIDGAARVGASIDKDELYQQRPPRRTKDTTVEEIEAAECVAKAVALDYVNLAHEKGGPEAALLMGNHTGVLLCIASVRGKRMETHAFLYGSYVTHVEHPGARGAIIDNRPTAPMRLIEASDRASANAARHAISSFFGDAEVRIKHVYRLRNLLRKRKRIIKQ